MVEETVIARGPQGYNWLHFVLRFEVVSIFFFFHKYYDLLCLCKNRRIYNLSTAQNKSMVYSPQAHLTASWSMILYTCRIAGLPRVSIEKWEKESFITKDLEPTYKKWLCIILLLNCLLSEEFRIKKIYKFYKYPNIGMGHCYCYWKYCYWTLLLLLHCYWNITTEYKRVLIRVSSTFDNLETGGFALE